ncbi:MAG TPA: glycosyltransferase [Rhodanobacteraceae bacterium]|nr:glycosyltransferase [Rhodanobacteraceae bacterium]
MREIHLITRDNGAGLSEDLRLLAATLVELGHAVRFTEARRSASITRLRLRTLLAWRGRREGARRGRFEINLMIERVRPKLFPLAWRNVLIPNPEWFAEDALGTLSAFDRVWVKTAHAARIFSALGCRTEWIGFSSRDRLDRGIARRPWFLHLAGRSRNKGTRALLSLWARNPGWPRLTVVWRRKDAGVLPQCGNIVYYRDYLPDDLLKQLQNAHRFHLCPSETEGFGHYLVEAASVGAVIITLDAPPMNELVTGERGLLVPAMADGRQGLATLYRCQDGDLAAAVEHAVALTDSGRQALGVRARVWYETNASAFPGRIAAALANLT